jgi:hypothetical protein
LVICHREAIILKAFLCALKDSLGHIGPCGDLFGAVLKAIPETLVNVLNEFVTALFDASSFFLSALFGDCLWRA